MDIHKPSDIERTSMSIIEQELSDLGLALVPGTEDVVKRVIHTTADFSFAETLCFSEDAMVRAAELMSRPFCIVTDTNMTRAGVSKRALSKLEGTVECYMADPQIAREAAANGCTRAVQSMRRASAEHPDAIFAVGNAPTALMELCRLMERNDAFRPGLIIGVPVGFVNVTESKELLKETCDRLGVPYIISMGRKGGSTVSAAICNALLYQASDLLDPAKRN